MAQTPPGSPLAPLPAITPGRYRHYKGGEYEVIGVVRHSESLEPMVLYRPLYNDSGSWVRPLAMFRETVEHEGRRQLRFSRVEADHPADAPRGPELPPSPLPGVRVVRLDEPWEGALQRFFEANPAYFEEALGEPPAPDAAILEIRDLPPADFPYSELFLLGFVQEDGELMALASVVSDLLAAGVWHIGLFIVATERHGSGDAARLHGGLQAWAERQGARWMRLGVVQGRVRAERFWARQGYQQVRLREGVEMGRLTNRLRVMVKPLGGHTVEEYLQRVERDRPAAWAPAA